MFDDMRPGADVIVARGDVLSRPQWPVRVAGRQIALGLPAIRGHHDGQLLRGEADRLRSSDRCACPARRAAGKAASPPLK